MCLHIFTTARAKVKAVDPNPFRAVSMGGQVFPFSCLPYAYLYTF